MVMVFYASVTHVIPLQSQFPYCIYSLDILDNSAQRIVLFRIFTRTVIKSLASVLYSAVDLPQSNSVMFPINPTQ